MTDQSTSNLFLMLWISSKNTKVVLEHFTLALLHIIDAFKGVNSCHPQNELFSTTLSIKIGKNNVTFETIIFNHDNSVTFSLI